MNGLRKGLLLAGVHLALVLSLGAKLLADRATRPRVWVKAAPVDPDLPIRGRYVSLRVEVPVTGLTFPPPEPRPVFIKVTDPWPPRWQSHGVHVRLSMESGRLIAHVLPKEEEGLAVTYPETMRALPREQWTVRLSEPVVYFIPEHVPDPSRRAADEELWVEATVPKKGPLRPIRLAVKKNGVLTPLNL